VTARVRALELSRRSLGLYNDGDYQGSIQLLETAYGTYPEPVLLYNLGRAYEKLGRTSKAIDEYERYLGAVPAAPDRAEIERRIEALRREGPAPSKSADAAHPPAAPAGTTPSPYPWILAGAGVLVIGGGVVLGSIASNQHNQAVAEHDAGRAGSTQDDAKRLAMWTNVAIVTGAAMAAAGVVWEVISLVSGPNPTGTRSGVDVRVGVGAAFVQGRF
jgi:tetratricopeptide (TPR) repeat protein